MNYVAYCTICGVLSNINTLLGNDIMQCLPVFDKQIGKDDIFNEFL